MAPKSLGVRHLAKHREGRRLTYKAAVLAKCADCMNEYVDGLADCRMPACPLYPFQPYRSKAGSRVGAPKNAGQTP